MSDAVLVALITAILGPLLHVILVIGLGVLLAQGHQTHKLVNSRMDEMLLMAAEQARTEGTGKP